MGLGSDHCKEHDLSESTCCFCRDAEIAQLQAEVEQAKHDLAAHKRALAAGPAALEDADVSPRIVKLVEAAQEAALEEK